MNGNKFFSMEKNGYQKIKLKIFQSNKSHKLKISYGKNVYDGAEINAKN